MLENFIYAKKKSWFLKELEAGNVLDEAIVFIEDSGEIWNRNTFFGASTDIIKKVSSLETKINTADEVYVWEYDDSGSTSVYNDLYSAILSDKVIIMKYTESNSPSTLSAISYIKTDLISIGTKVSDTSLAITFFNPLYIVEYYVYSDGSVEYEETRYATYSYIDTINSEVAKIESAVGLNTDGSFKTISGNYTSSATTTTEAIQALDTLIKSNADNIPTKVSELENDSNFATNSTLTTELAKKQDNISDLTTIRSGATLGATALQSIPDEYITEDELIEKGYATTSELSDAITTHDTDENAHESIRNSVSLANTAATDAVEQAANAVDVAYEFAQVAQEAKTTAEAAVQSIASLEGLADADTSALTVAELVTQIETNAANINYLLDRDVVISQADFDALETKDVTKHYFIYE